MGRLPLLSKQYFEHFGFTVEGDKMKTSSLPYTMSPQVDPLLQHLAWEFGRQGWRDIQPQSHFGINFELVGSRRFLFTKWNVLVRRLHSFDQTTVEAVGREFEMISFRSKSWFWGRCFLLCIVADQVEPYLHQSIASDDFGLFGVFRLQGGGGNVLVADLANQYVHGTVPSLPFDAHKFTKGGREILENLCRMPRF
jgi:hypothetical protein